MAQKTPLDEMNQIIRPAIAYIAGRSILRKNTSAIYDYSIAAYLQFGGEVSDAKVNIFDYRMNCYIIGNWNKGFSNLFHYGINNYVQITVNGTHYNGYDYQSNSYFQGYVAGGIVNLYDYQDGRYYQYFI